MQNTIAIKQLSREEKLWVMEALWEDLSAEDELIESSEWHRDALQETELRLSSGQEKIMEWQDAKEVSREVKL